MGAMSGVAGQSALIGSPGTMGLAVPTRGDVAASTLDFVRDLQQDFIDRDRLCAIIEDVIYLRQKVQIPKNFENTAVEVRSPLAPHIANSITAALSMNNPRITYRPTEFGDAGYEAAAYRERFFQAAWQRQQYEKGRRVYRSFMHSVVTKGLGVLKTFERRNRVWAKYTDYSKDLLSDLDGQVASGELDANSRSRIFDGKTEQYKKGLPYPIETTDIPPETFYYQMGEDGLVRVAEVRQVPYYDTLRLFGAAFDGRGKVCFDDVVGLAVPDTEWYRCFETTSRRTIQMVELWDSEFCTVVLRGPGDFPSAGSGTTGSGLAVRKYRHSYGDPHRRVLKGPYFMAGGITTSSRKHAEQNLGVLFAYLHLFPLLNSLLTMQNQAAFNFSYPTYKRSAPPTFGLPQTPFGANAMDLANIRQKIVPGTIFPHDIQAMDQPRTTIDLDKAINGVQQMIQMALPDSAQGVISGETAGYALNQAAHLASIAWDPIKDNVEVTLAQRVSWESELIDTHVGETVYVWGSIPQPVKFPGTTRDYKDGWMGLGPKDLKNGSHNYVVSIEAASVNNDTLKLRTIKEKLDLRLMDPAEAVREMGGNPVEVERAWILYELKQDPLVRKQLTQRVFQQLATIDQASMQALPAGAQPGGAPPVETSGMPPGALPGISQGAPTTGFVPPAGATAPAAPTPVPPMNSLPGTPGTPAGAPGGVRGAPALHVPIPGGG